MNSTKLRAHVAAFIATFCEHLERTGGSDSHNVLQRLKSARLRDVRAQPCKLEVARYWPDTLQGAEVGPTAQLVEKLKPLSPFLAWVQNPNYTRGRASADFLSNYGYAELLGKDGLFDNDSLALGMLLLGPSTVYAEHHHPAAETYYVAAGQAFWNLAGGSDIAASPGTRITIPPEVIHKMWTIDEPLIAIYVWDGDVRTRADFVGAGNNR